MHHYMGSLTDVEHNLCQQLAAKVAPDNTMWCGRTKTLLHHALPIVFEYAALTQTPLSKATLLERLQLPCLLRLLCSSQISESSKAQLRLYLNDLPGFNNGALVQAALQHGYITMMLETIESDDLAST